jgi:uncharacterized protein (DUF983 family)
VSEAAARTWRTTLAAVLRERCPRCLQGHVFRGLIAMNERCPVCGYAFTRESGYFYGAVVFSYTIAVAVYGALVSAAGGCLAATTWSG